MRYLRLTAAALSIALLWTAPAFASHCPVDIQKIDEALSGDHGLSDDQLAQVTELRDEGEELHNSGKHGESIDRLHKALEMLGMPHE